MEGSRCAHPGGAKDQASDTGAAGGAAGPEPNISALERGVKPPSLETLICIANELDVSADTILQDVGSRSSLGASGELSELLARQDPELQRTVLRAVRAMIEK